MIPYRIRQLFKRSFLTVLILLMVIALVIGVWFLWLERFIVYTENGIRFDFQLQDIPEGQFVSPPDPQPTVPIIYADDEEQEELVSYELKQMIGYYIDKVALEDIATVRQQLSQLPAGTPVMMDVKNIYGSFFYSSKVCSQRDSSYDSAQVDALIAYMKELELYPIARLPALRDYYYGLNNVPYGLPEAGGGGWLWHDEFYCYWLDPTKEGTVSYLIDIITELKGLGFREAVFYDFRFPDTDKITFHGDKEVEFNGINGVELPAEYFGSLSGISGASYSFVLELGNWANGQWVSTSMESKPAEYAALVQNQHITKWHGLTPSYAKPWTPTQFQVVPEPNSGILLIVGGAFLMLRRRRNVIS